MVDYPHDCILFLALAREANRLRSVATDDADKRVANSRQMIAASRALIAKADAIIELDRKVWG